MDVICLNAVRFTVEFIKLFMVVVIFFKIRQRNSIYASYFTALFAIMYVSLFIDVSQFGVIGILSVVILIANAYEKKKAGMIMLSFMAISIVDIIFASLCIVIFQLDMDKIEGNALLNIGLNLFSLALIFVIAFVMYKKRAKYRQVQIKKYITIYLIGGLSLTFYLTSLQFMAMEEKWSVYGKNLIIGMSLSSLVLVAFCVLLIINSNQNEHLKKVAKINADLLETQKEYYTMLLGKENETRAFRHDIKNHLYCMYNLYKDKKYEELEKYFVAMNDRVEELSPRIQTGNSLVNAIVNDISGKYPEVQLQWTGMIPDELQISSLDICTIFYNLLSNAFEAVWRNHECKVDVTARFMESTMMITISNPITGEPQRVNGEFVTSKSEDGHGYGIKNVQKCVEKNGGLYSIACDDGLFVSEIIIPKTL